MLRATLTLEELASRGQRVQKLLRPLTQHESSAANTGKQTSRQAGKYQVGPAFEQISSQGNYVIAAYNGTKTTSEFTKWRFSTYLNRYWAAYHEIWRPNNTYDFYYMFQAYLSVFEFDPTSREEYPLILIHCDPNEPDNANHAKYKQGPHMHVSASRQPLPHCHFGLNMGHLDAVLNSVDALTDAFELAVIMVKQQVLDEIAEKKKPVY